MILGIDEIHRILHVNMKKFVIYAVLLGWVPVIFAKGYEVIGEKKKTFYVGQDISTDNNIYIKSIKTAGNVTIAYERMDVSIPSGWDYSFCDNVGCYFSFPESGSYAPLYPSEEAYMKVTVKANGKAGTMTVKYALWDTEDPTNKDTFEYTIIQEWNLSSASSSAEIMKVSPNPFTDVLLVSGLEQSANYQVLALDGRVIRSGEVFPDQVIDLSDLTTGCYALQLGDALSRKSFKIVKQ